MTDPILCESFFCIQNPRSRKKINDNKVLNLKRKKNAYICHILDAGSCRKYFYNLVIYLFKMVFLLKILFNSVRK